MAAAKIPMVDSEFVAETAQRSLPNPHRPRLSTDCENRLAEVDRRDAAKYASMETLTHQFNAMADAIEAEVVDEPSDGVPSEGETFDDESLVHHIEETRAQLGRR